jgi:16S rRNA (cytidine1402-2'-O)-methyltransferase
MINSESTSAPLYLIPCPIGDNSPLEVLPILVRKIVTETQHFIVENEKKARRFIKKLCPEKNQTSLELYTLNKYTAPEEIGSYLDPCKKGITMGLLSDAGCPGIADPGAIIIAKAHFQGIRVKPLVGPSSIVLAQMSSGLNGQNFAFNGYLPIEKSKRKKLLKQLEKRSQKQDQSQIFIETPYRNDQMFSDLIGSLHSETKLCVAYNLTLEDEFVKTAPIYKWKKVKLNFNKRPAIFILHKEI